MRLSLPRPGYQWKSRRVLDRPRTACVVEAMEGRVFLSDTGASISADFDWSMPPRYGLDRNHNGRIDLPNSRNYVNPPKGYTLVLDASKAASPSPISSYHWTITGGSLSGPKQVWGVSASVPRLALGTYSVQLDITDASGGTASATQAVTLRDILIVALGDSYSSGEGNPDVPKSGKKAALWADGVTKAMTEENRQAHRSTFAASSQAALAIERADPHSSVTFTMLSTSGAEVQNILGTEMNGRENPEYQVPAQIPELQGIVGNRRIDLLTLSIGGNDIGFSDRISDMMNPFTRNAAILKTFRPLVSALPKDYRRLGRDLRKHFSIGNVIITDYPDPTHDDSGQTVSCCNDIAYVLPHVHLSISASEAEWAQKNILSPLNAAVQTAASANKWQFAGPVSSDFLTHGYAATDTWFVTNTVALQRQGSAPGYPQWQYGLVKINMSYGALHPNEKGHTAIASRLLALMSQDIVLVA